MSPAARQAFELLVGVLYLAGVYSVAITIRRVARHWKAIYWLGLVTVIIKAAAFVVAFMRDSLQVPGADDALVRNLFLVSFVLVGLLFLLVPYIHRYEAKLLGPSTIGIGEEDKS